MVDSSNSKVTNFVLYGEMSKEKLLVDISKKEIVKRKLPAFIVYVIILSLVLFTFLYINPFHIESTILSIYTIIVTTISIIAIINKVFPFSDSQKEINIEKTYFFDDNKEISDDTFLQKTFPELYNQDRSSKVVVNNGYYTYRQQDIVKKLNYMVKDPEYGKDFSDLLIEIMNAKKELPLQDRHELEAESSKAIRDLYRLIIENKTKRITSNNNVQKYVLGYEELNKID